MGNRSWCRDLIIYTATIYTIYRYLIYSHSLPKATSDIVVKTWVLRCYSIQNAVTPSYPCVNSVVVHHPAFGNDLICHNGVYNKSCVVSWPASIYWVQCVCYVFGCPTSSHADAGDVVASHLPNWKNLRKVEVCYMNPVPILLSVGSCGKLDEFVVINPKHCEVSFPIILFTHAMTTRDGSTTSTQ